MFFIHECGHMYFAYLNIGQHSIYICVCVCVCVCGHMCFIYMNVDTCVLHTKIICEHSICTCVCVCGHTFSLCINVDTCVLHI